MFRNKWFMMVLFCACSMAAFAQNKALEIVPLTERHFVYTTFNTYNNSKVPAHGMYMVNDTGVVLIDTPWDTTQFQPLLDSIEKRHHLPVVLCISTHWHDDRTAGLSYYQSMGIPTFTSYLTDTWCVKNDAKRAQYYFVNDTLFGKGEFRFETFYPGPGHTVDNIVLWFPESKILYGGCLIKGASALDLGYLGDADTQRYYSTLKRVKERYAHARIILVSHHDWRNKKSLAHSIKLAKRLLKE